MRNLASSISLISLLLLSTTVAGMVGLDEQTLEDGDLEEVFVQATRSGRRVQDAAIRVEALSGEEIEEKLLMRASNISMMLKADEVVPYSTDVDFCQRMDFAENACELLGFDGAGHGFFNARRPAYDEVLSALLAHLDR